MLSERNINRKGVNYRTAGKIKKKLRKQNAKKKALHDRPIPLNEIKSEDLTKKQRRELVKRDKKKIKKEKKKQMKEKEMLEEEV